MFEYARNLHNMRWIEISTIRAPGPGTIFFFKKLCPEAFAFLTRMHRRAAMGDSEESDEAGYHYRRHATDSIKRLLMNPFKCACSCSGGSPYTDINPARGGLKTMTGQS